MFNPALFKALPLVHVTSAADKPLGGNRFAITAAFVNDGGLPTALEIAKRVKIVKPDSAVLEFAADAGVQVVKGKALQDIGWFEAGETRQRSRGK